VINEAAVLAASKNLKAVTGAELDEARDKVRWGRERRSLAINDKEKENTAYHEAGHAICNVLLEHTHPLHKVTIIPRGPALGVTMMLPKEDQYTMRKNSALDQLIVTMGGRVAEELVFGDVTNGAAGDIKQATSLAKKMVCSWGMSDKLGMVSYGENSEHLFLARDISKPRNYSAATAQAIDDEIKMLIDNAYAKSTEILTAHRDKMDILAKALLEFETLDGQHVKDILEHGRMLNPPRNSPPEIPKEEPKPKPESEGDGPIPGDLAPAGA